MKILLTCTSVDDAHRTETDHDSHYPLGLAYLHSYLNKHQPQHEIETHFLNNVNWEICINKLREEMKSFQPDVVGISMMTHSRRSAFKFIDYLTKNYPKVKIVLGGIHPTIMWKQIVNKYRNSVIVIGEGEITFGELIECYEKNLPIDKIGGIVYYDGEKVFHTGERGLIDDLDILPPPKHDIFLFNGKTVANLLTSRGCPFKCNFCVLDHVSLKKVRYRSPSDICDEVEQILEMCPSVQIIWLHDDAFMINKKLTVAICDEIIRRGIKTTFTCSARFRPISRDLVKKMEEAGFTHVLFGLESGANEVMKGMRKGINKNHIRYAVSLLAESNIKTTAFLIAGLPGESEETIKETIDFVQELQSINYLYYDDMGICGIYPGAEVFDIAKEKKMMIPGYGPIDDDYWLTQGEVPVYEAENTEAQLLEWKEQIRDGIAFNRMRQNPQHFLKQRKLLPSVIKWSWQQNWLLKPMVEQIINQYNLLPEVIHKFFTNRRREVILKISSIVEKTFMTELMKTMTIEEKQNSISDYRKQLEEDNKTLERWKTSKIPATDEYIKPVGEKVDKLIQMSESAARKEAQKKANPRLSVLA